MLFLSWFVSNCARWISLFCFIIIFSLFSLFSFHFYFTLKSSEPDECDCFGLFGPSRKRSVRIFQPHSNFWSITILISFEKRLHKSTWHVLIEFWIHLEIKLKSIRINPNIFLWICQKSLDPEYRSAPASVQNMFAKIAGEDMEVDARELQDLLNFSLKKGKFLSRWSSLRTCVAIECGMKWECKCHYCPGTILFQPHH